MHGEKPHTLSEGARRDAPQRIVAASALAALTSVASVPQEWQDAWVMRRAYMPREAAGTPVPHNPFRHNRSGADVVLAGSKARWPADAAARTPKGSRAVELPERAAVAASATPPPPQYEGAEPEVEARVEAAVSKTGDSSE